MPAERFYLRQWELVSPNNMWPSLPWVHLDDPGSKAVSGRYVPKQALDGRLENHVSGALTRCFYDRSIKNFVFIDQYGDELVLQEPKSHYLRSQSRDIIGQDSTRQAAMAKHALVWAFWHSRAATRCDIKGAQSANPDRALQIV